MNDLLFCPFVVAVGIIGFLIAMGAVALPVVIGAAAVVPLGLTAQLRKKRQHS